MPVSHETSADRALYDSHAIDWLAAVSSRHSRRAFHARAVDAGTLESMLETCRAWRPYQNARTVLVTRPQLDVFTGIIGSYGKVVGAPHVLVFIGDERSDFPDQHVGYTGEAIVLEATRLGLATCWVGGFFSARKVARMIELAPGERVFAVSPLGHALERSSSAERTVAGLARAHRRKCVDELVRGVSRVDWPAWAVAAVETARLAPSATNRQPWRFRFEDGGLLISKDSALEIPKVAKRLDIGIAMLHAELAASAHGILGTWRDLTGLDVARFDPQVGE